MELADVFDHLMHAYEDISTELGAVLGFVFVMLGVMIVVVFISMFINARANARNRNAQSDTLRTINNLVREQSEREDKATTEAQRLNNLLLQQTNTFNERFHDQAQRLTILEVKVPIYEEEITDLKATRDSLLTAIREERQEWRSRERAMETRHIEELSGIKTQFDEVVSSSAEMAKKLAVVEARLEERERENKRRESDNERVNMLILQLASMEESINTLVEVITNEFANMGNRNATAVAGAVDVAGGVHAGDGAGKRDSVRDRYATRGGERRSAGKRGDDTGK